MRLVFKFLEWVWWSCMTIIGFIAFIIGPVLLVLAMIMAVVDDIIK
jgi:hypothetical protein